MQARGAGSGNCQVRAFKAKTHGHVARSHIDDGRRHKKRRNAPWSACGVFDIGVFDHRQAADARADHAGDACGFFFSERVAGAQTGVFDRLDGCSDAEMDEAVHGPRILGADVALKLKTAHFTRNLAGKGRCVKFRNQANARLTCKQVRPRLFHRITYGTDATQTSNYHATTGHIHLF